jgi:hypothetical protein
MRRRTETICIGLALMIGLPASPSARAEERTPCLKIKQVCEEAGFKQNAIAEGLGLQVDCSGKPPPNRCQPSTPPPSPPARRKIQSSASPN